MDAKTAQAPSALALAMALALSLAPAACLAPDEAGTDPGDDSTRLAKSVPRVDRRTGDSIARASDSFRLDSAGIEGDSLILHVTTGGGCREHVFTLYSSEHILLSSPSGVEMWLHHEGNDDHCKALLNYRLAYGLGSIRGLDPEGYVWLHRHPDQGGSPLHVWLPRPSLRYPLRLLGLAAAESLAVGSDPLEVTGHRLDGDTLRIQVSYPGGCRKHVFTPYVSNQAVDSFPPQFTVWIHHDADGDPCEALPSSELALDVGELVRPVSQAFFHVLPLASLR